MFLGKRTLIEEVILHELQHGPLHTLEIVGRIQNLRPHTSKQGVYAALRVLRKEEVTVVHGGTVSLHLDWLSRVNRFSTVARYYYLTGERREGNFITLTEGERVRYRFRSAALTDGFWDHVLFTLIEIADPAEPLYLYNPHWWFILARPESEQRLMEFTREKKRLFLMTVPHRFPLDRKAKEEVDGVNAQYVMISHPLFQKKNYYLNVIDDYILEVFIDPFIAELIEEFYQGTSSFSDVSVQELRRSIEIRGENKLILSRNRNRAQRLKKKLSKNFRFPRIRV